MLDEFDVTGVLLAAGQSRRMREATSHTIDPPVSPINPGHNPPTPGHKDPLKNHLVNKCLLSLGQRTLLHHVISRAAPQVNRLLLNIGDDAKPFADYPLTLIHDTVPGHAGPLAGILSAMDWMRTYRPHSHWLMSFASDTPFIPLDMVERFRGAIETEQTRLASAKSGDQVHPVFSLWPISLHDDLRTYLLVEKQRKVQDFIDRFPVSRIDFSQPVIDPFFNINTREDLENAENMYSLIGAAQ